MVTTRGGKRITSSDGTYDLSCRSRNKTASKSKHKKKGKSPNKGRANNDKLQSDDETSSLLSEINNPAAASTPRENVPKDEANETATESLDGTADAQIVAPNGEVLVCSTFVGVEKEETHMCR